MKYVLVLITVFSISCARRPGQIRNEKRSERIEVIECQRIFTSRIAIIKDKETGSEFLIFSEGGVAKIK